MKLYVCDNATKLYISEIVFMKLNSIDDRVFFIIIIHDIINCEDILICLY